MMMTSVSTGARPRRAFFWLGAMALGGLLALGGCATPPPPTASTEVLSFDEAMNRAADGLVTQARQQGGLLAQMGAAREAVVDGMLDASTGQQTAATERLQGAVLARLAAGNAPVKVLPFDAASLGKSSYLLTGTLTRTQPGDDGRRQPLKLNLALTDLASRKVVAQSSALARDEGVDHTPLAYYRNSPVVVKDRVIDGYVRTSTTPPGEPADGYYMERLAVAPAVQQGAALVNAERYQDALGQYNTLAAGGASDQLRVLSGIYISAMKLGKTQEAQKAFDDIVRFGLANRRLGVMFLFNPGGTVFWSDPAVSGPYGMWLREIARLSTEAKVCMNVVGHTSRTGSQAFNDTLSLDRANTVRQRLGSESAPLLERTKASGRGFRENLVGSGTDNAVDALDRRVEFLIADCQ